MNALSILLQAQPGASMGSTLLMFAAIIVVFYFFMIRPQAKRQKELKAFQESLKKGDRVIIAGGVYGKISEIKEEYAVVEVDDNVRIKVIKSTIIRDAADIQTAR